MKRKILIIEDEKNLIQVLKDNFLQEGFEVISAFNGEEGVEEFYSKTPDIILLDINLPKKTGWEVCKEIRKISSVPILMMTARDSDEDEYKGLDLGADDYITKPFNLKILTLKVKKILKLDDNSIYKYENFSFDIKKERL